MRHTLTLTIPWTKPWDLFLKLQAWAIVLTMLSVAVLVASIRAVLTPHGQDPKDPPDDPSAAAVCTPGLGCATIAPAPQLVAA